MESKLECSHKLLLCKTGFSFAISIVYPYGGGRVCVERVESLGGHFACLRREFEIYEVKKEYYFSKRKLKYFYTFYHFYSERAKEHKSTAVTPNLPE